ncbi:MAG: MATE family efflux transporter, partial [Pseudomonadota bacterium]|nr:MATE family efflux transporter [Pseudomonadota bacterium]
GAAWAFVIGAMTQLALAAYWYFIKARMIPTSLKHLSSSVRQILHVGVPAAATNLLQPITLAISTFLVASYGTEVVAGFGVAGRIESVVGMVAIGISTSVVPVVGQNWGAALYDRAMLAIKTCYWACLIWGVTAAVLMWFGAPFFVALITNDELAATVAVEYLLIVPLSIGFMGMLTVANHGFNAIRRPGPALALSVARLVLIYLPLALIASYYFAYLGIFAAIALANVIAGLAAAIWFRKTAYALAKH